MLICVLTIYNVCVCTYTYEYLFLVYIWAFYMASLNLGNPCKGHINLLPAVRLTGKYIWERPDLWPRSKVALCSPVAGNRISCSKQSECLDRKLFTDISGLGSVLLW
jgi:hypothetical protein